MASVTYTLLDGEWPILNQATPVPASVIEAISSDTTGFAMTSNLGHLSVGYFFIDVDLVEQHSSQRPILSNHADILKEDFEKKGVFRTESPGVVIGLGEGWNYMKNIGPNPFRITKSSPHLHHLSLSPNGPIAQVISGGHHTEAIKHFSTLSGQPDENYWFYNVLLPGKYYIASFTFTFSYNTSLLSNQ